MDEDEVCPIVLSEWEVVGRIKITQEASRTWLFKLGNCPVQN